MPHIRHICFEDLIFTAESVEMSIAILSECGVSSRHLNDEESLYVCSADPCDVANHWQILKKNFWDMSPSFQKIVCIDDALRPRIVMMD